MIIASSQRNAAMKTITCVGIAIGMLAFAAAPAWAGRGSSPEQIRRAIGSGSVDAIAAELEHSEHLVCGSCIKMVEPLIDHDDARVRQVAAWWLARRGRTELFVAMAERLAQPDSVKARNAADVLGELRMPKAVIPLGAALNNPVFTGEARAAMARALGVIGARAGMPALEKAMLADDAQVRAAAAEGLRGIDDFDDASAVVPLLRDGDATVRGQAIYTIAFTRSKAMRAKAAGQAVEGLVALVAADPSPDVRKRAAWALGEMGAPVAVAGPALSKAAQSDSSPLVRSLASAALGRLSP